MGIVVLGIGNVRMSDEGIGVHAVKALQERYLLPERVKVIDGGAAGMELLPEIEDASLLIVIDAVRVGMPPGTVVCMEDDEVAAFFKTKLTPQQVGLSDILATLHRSGRGPLEATLIGVQPDCLDMTMALSPKVAARMNEVLGLVKDQLAFAGCCTLAREYCPDFVQNYGSPPYDAALCGAIEAA
ncbi:MAG TPA: HyaD/HybD family hydrogenase maturation endopeptidase [Telmatospirillum sp.]|nr:HyaD/HybD family hydrogenase maturation endopeptidase [Telmatospirillum sp.]